MKHLAKFESFESGGFDDIKIIEDIFEDEVYDNIYLLKQEVKKISDKRLVLGLLIELVVRYDVDKEEIFDIVNSFDKKEVGELDKAHDYFVEKMNSDVRAKLWKFFERDNLENDEEFIEWLKSLTESEVQTIQDYCVELEFYELIPFMKSLRNQ